MIFFRSFSVFIAYIHRFLIFYSIQIDNPHDIPVNIGITIKPILVRINVIELAVVAIITILSNDFTIIIIIWYFLYFFLDVLFLSLKYVHIFFMSLLWVLKLLTSFNFFSNICSKSLFSNGALGYNLSVFWSFSSERILQIYPSKTLHPYDKSLSLQVELIKLL